MYSIVEFKGGQSSYTFPFDYLSRKFIHVRCRYADGTTSELIYGTDYQVNNKTVNLNVSSTTSDKIIIYRKTSTDLLVDFQDASILLAKEMNTTNMQMQHVLEENTDTISYSSMVQDERGWNAQAARIYNLDDPVDDNDAMTYGSAKQAVTDAEQSMERSEDAARISMSSRDEAQVAEANAQNSATKAETARMNALQSEANSKQSENMSKYYSEQSLINSNGVIPYNFFSIIGEFKCPDGLTIQLPQRMNMLLDNGKLFEYINATGDTFNLNDASSWDTGVVPDVQDIPYYFWITVTAGVPKFYFSVSNVALTNFEGQSCKLLGGFIRYQRTFTYISGQPLSPSYLTTSMCQKGMIAFRSIWWLTHHRNSSNFGFNYIYIPLLDRWVTLYGLNTAGLNLPMNSYYNRPIAYTNLTWNQVTQLFKEQDAIQVYYMPSASPADVTINARTGDSNTLSYTGFADVLYKQKVYVGNTAYYWNGYTWIPSGEGVLRYACNNSTDITFRGDVHY